MYYGNKNCILFSICHARHIPLSDSKGPPVSLEVQAGEGPWHLFHPGEGTEKIFPNYMVFNADASKCSNILKH